MATTRLVLTLNPGESVDIDGPCRVTLNEVDVRGRSHLVFEAEPSVNILRENARRRLPGEQA